MNQSSIPRSPGDHGPVAVSTGTPVMPQASASPSSEGKDEDGVKKDRGRPLSGEQCQPCLSCFHKALDCSLRLRASQRDEKCSRCVRNGDQYCIQRIPVSDPRMSEEWPVGRRYKGEPSPPVWYCIRDRSLGSKDVSRIVAEYYETRGSYVNGEFIMEEDRARFALPGRYANPARADDSNGDTTFVQHGKIHW